ncbi:hypothetical protein G6F63_015215 [Rhizopus arrhizus]|nr:hypothetical protein G6F63_015215 [Rhizopus arrhizus]
MFNRYAKRIPSCHVVRRGFALAAMLSALTLSANALAEDAAKFPSHPIRFIVPYAAGGLQDTVARVVAQRISQNLGQSVVVENKPGANGVIAAQTLTSSPRDGYTYLVTDGSMMSINPALYKDLSYDPKRDFPEQHQYAPGVRRAREA